MSFDFRLKNTCTHEVVAEIRQVEDDLRSLLFERPPSASSPGQIKLKANGFIIDPVNDPQFSFSLVRDNSFIPPPIVAGTYRGPRVQNKKKLYFDKSLRSRDDIFELTYFTDERNCRRCHGLRLEDDIRFDLQGKPIQVRNNQKLLQDVQKFVFTMLGSNPFHELVGTNAFTLIGSKLSNIQLTSLKLQQEITTTLQVYQERQITQATVQEVTDSEMLFKVISVNVERNDQDPSIIDIRIVFSNNTFGETEIAESVTIPGFNQALFGDARKSYGLTEMDANNSGIPGTGTSPVSRFRSIPNV